MKNIKAILEEKNNAIQLIKHQTNTNINDFWNEINGKKIHFEIGWVYIYVSLVSNKITFNLEHIKNNNKYVLSATINITTILAENFTKNNVHFMQSYPANSNILDPRIWLEMKNRLYQVIDEYIGYY